MNTNMQLRVKTDKELEEFSLKGKEYKIIGPSDNRRLVPRDTSPFWSIRQYIAEDKEGKQYDVYVYYYGAFNTGEQYAVIDAMDERR